MIQLPFLRRIKSTRRCERCGRHTPAQEENCQHCHDLSDRELQTLKDADANQSDAHARIGITMIIIAVLLMGLMAWAASRV